MTHDFSTKEALKTLSIVSTLLDESDPYDRISMTLIPARRQVNSIRQLYIRTSRSTRGSRDRTSL